MSPELNILAMDRQVNYFSPHQHLIEGHGLLVQSIDDQVGVEALWVVGHSNDLDIFDQLVQPGEETLNTIFPFDLDLSSRS